MLLVWVIGWNSYNILKKQMQGGDPNYVTSPSQHLLAAAEASASKAFSPDRDRSLYCSLTRTCWGLGSRCDHGHADEPDLGGQDEGVCQ